MKAFSGVLLPLAASLVAALAQAAPPERSATVSNGSQIFMIDLPDADGGFVIGGEISQIITFASGDQVSISGYMQSDPFISYNVGFTDAGAPSIFTLDISLPLSPLLSGPNEVRASLDGSFSIVGG